MSVKIEKYLKRIVIVNFIVLFFFVVLSPLWAWYVVYPIVHKSTDIEDVPLTSAPLEMAIRHYDLSFTTTGIVIFALTANVWFINIALLLLVKKLKEERG